nr:hypothetical protein [Burkholderiales bacterium]
MMENSNNIVRKPPVAKYQEKMRSSLAEKRAMRAQGKAAGVGIGGIQSDPTVPTPNIAPTICGLEGKIATSLIINFFIPDCVVNDLDNRKDIIVYIINNSKEASGTQLKEELTKKYPKHVSIIENLFNYRIIDNLEQLRKLPEADKNQFKQDLENIILGLHKIYGALDDGVEELFKHQGKRIDYLLNSLINNPVMLNRIIRLLPSLLDKSDRIPEGIPQLISQIGEKKTHNPEVVSTWDKEREKVVFSIRLLKNFVDKVMKNRNFMGTVKLEILGLKVIKELLDTNSPLYKTMGTKSPEFIKSVIGAVLVGGSQFSARIKRHL